jgi:hypothetical protein
MEVNFTVVGDAAFPLHSVVKSVQPPTQKVQAAFTVSGKAKFSRKLLKRVGRLYAGVWAIEGPFAHKFC